MAETNARVGKHVGEYGLNHKGSNWGTWNFPNTENWTSNTEHNWKSTTTGIQFVLVFLQAKAILCDCFCSRTRVHLVGNAEGQKTQCVPQGDLIFGWEQSVMLNCIHNIAWWMTLPLYVTTAVDSEYGLLTNCEFPRQQPTNSPPTLLTWKTSAMHKTHSQGLNKLKRHLGWMAIDCGNHTCSCVYLNICVCVVGRCRIWACIEMYRIVFWFHPGHTYFCSNWEGCYSIPPHIIVGAGKRDSSREKVFLQVEKMWWTESFGICLLSGAFWINNFFSYTFCQYCCC